MPKQLKIDKVIEEISKTKLQIDELQIRLKKLEQQKTEIENSEIIGIVRGGNISADELFEMIKLFQEDKQTKFDRDNKFMKEMEVLKIEN